MLRYSDWMRFRIYVVSLVVFAPLVVFSGCGDETGVSSGSSTSLTAPELEVGPGVEVKGNVINGESLLVFAFLRSGENASDEPVSVGIIDEEGRFRLAGLPSGRIGITFLADGANDGVIDDGDPIANLTDPDQLLEDLQSGDRVQVTDVQLDLVSKRAVADSIEVGRAEDSLPAEPTPTPES
jgi:hypothetical protein